MPNQNPEPPASLTTEDRFAPMTAGECSACRVSYNRADMQEHLVVCPQRLDQLARSLGWADADALKPLGAKSEIRMHRFQMNTVLVYDKYAPQTYWLYLAVPSVCSLVKLDSFLKLIWLECCGHLSQFDIDGKIYARYPDQEYEYRREYNMSGMKLGKLFDKGVGSFSYTYDYGSSTELGVEILASWEGAILGKRPEIGTMARNLPPNILCEECQTAPATVVLSVFESGDANSDFYGRGWLCARHANSRKYKEYTDYQLPVLNSPRTGRCGFDGADAPLLTIGQ